MVRRLLAIRGYTLTGKLSAFKAVATGVGCTVRTLQTDWAAEKKFRETIQLPRDGKPLPLVPYNRWPKAALGPASAGHFSFLLSDDE